MGRSSPPSIKVAAWDQADHPSRLRGLAREHTVIRTSTLAAALLLAAPVAQAQTDHHGHAAHLGQSVMPFDLARSTHVFTSTAQGGTQDVLSKDGDPRQVALIRQH